MKLFLFLFSAAIGNAVAITPTTVDDDGFQLAMRFSSDSQFVFCSPYWTDTELLDENDPDEFKDADGKFDPFVNTVAKAIKGCLGDPELGACKTYELETPMTLKDLFTNTPIGSDSNLQFSVNTDEVLEWEDIAQTNHLERGWYASGINFYDDKSDCPSNVRFGALFNNENTVRTTNDAVGFGATECGNHQFGGGAKVGAGTVKFRDIREPMAGRIYVLPAEVQEAPANPGTPAESFMVCPGPGFSDACKATAWGDPHIVTWDGLKFDAQPAGEAIFLKSTSESGSTLEIQGRIEKARENGIPAVTTGIVTRGDDESQPVIQVAIASEGGEMVPARNNLECPVELFVNGELQESVYYSESGVKVQRVGSTISIVYPSLLRVDMHTAFFGRCYFTTDFYLFDCDDRSDSVIGLLGSPNGNPNDDWMTTDGDVLELPADVSKYFFGPAFQYTKNNWIITDEDESLFNYEPGQDFSTFSDEAQKYDPEYEDSINNVSEEIIEICGDDVGCRIDGESLGNEAAEDYVENPASQRTPGSRVDEDGFELAMRFGTESDLVFCSPYWTDSILLDEDDHSATKDADGKFAPFVDTVASEIKGCLPGGCKVYVLPTPMTLKDLFTNTPIGSEDNIQFSVNNDEALEWEFITGQEISVETGWYASGINYYDDVSNCPSKVRFGGLFNNEGTISTTNDAIGFGATECGDTEVGAGAAIWKKRRYPSTGTIWVKPAVDPPPRIETTPPPAASPTNVCGSGWTSAPTREPTPPRTDAPTKAPTEEPTGAPTKAPTEAPNVSLTKLSTEETGDTTSGGKGVGSGSGDPHFKTWSGDKYDYHGECDLVLVDHPSFSDGLGLKVHIRTTRVKYFSYISNIAVQIGDDVLEFDNDVTNFLINGETAAPQQKYVRTLLGGFHLRRDPKAISIRFDDHIKARIDLIQRKNGWPAVVIDGATTEIFKGSLGLLGDWETGKRFARDGKTLMDDPDATNFALEWQVRDTEPMLFREARFPQYPTTCTPPAQNLSKRLGVSNFEKEAKKACAHWKEDIEDCIFDVIATRDVMVAAEGHVAAIA
jgi:hypothetical protein